MGFEKPNYTQVPNDLVDVWLAELSGAELKVLLYLVRRTVGFHRDRVRVGLRQICGGIPGKDHGTGLHIDTVVTVVSSLEARGLLVCERKVGGRTTYFPRIENQVYGKSEYPPRQNANTEVFGKSEYPPGENPKTEVFGKSEHKERKSSSSERKIRKESLSRPVDQRAGLPRPQQNTPKPLQPNFDGDETNKTGKSCTTPEEELRTIYVNKTGREISPDVLNRISETCELRGVPLSRYVEELRSHVPNSWTNPAGFLTDFARKFRSKANSLSSTQPATAASAAQGWARCGKCGGIGRLERGYCDCSIGRDLKRVEENVSAQAASPTDQRGEPERLDK